MSVPTKKEIINALCIPEVQQKLDRLGRRVCKKNFNIVKGPQPYYRNVRIEEVIRIKDQLYSR